MSDHVVEAGSWVGEGGGGRGLSLESGSQCAPAMDDSDASISLNLGLRRTPGDIPKLVAPQVFTAVLLLL